MSRFTIKGWIVLPFALALRIPFAILGNIFEFLGNLFRALANRSDRIMRAMPSPEFNTKWVKARDERIRKQILNRYTMGSQTVRR